MDAIEADRCPGCGALFAPMTGATHPYMEASPACWARFGQILAREYEDPALLATHRLSVDSYAVQHPGDNSRQAIQSVGLHLTRLMLQLERPMSPRQTNNVMLGLGRYKHTLPALDPPSSFAVTVRDVPIDAGAVEHAEAVRAWAQASWSAWSAHHATVRSWYDQVTAAGTR